MSRWFKYLLLALSPLLVFLAVYLAGCIIAGDFYKIPVAAAFMIASAYAMAITRSVNNNYGYIV